MPERASELRVGLVGYGFVGKLFHAPMIVRTPGLSLVAVSSSDASKVKADLGEIEVFSNPMEFVREADVDLVVIASPNESHKPLAEAALKFGKHVLVDKPFALNLEEARSIVAVAKEYRRFVSVFQNRRWDSDYLGVKKVLEEGRLGSVTHFESHIDRFRPEVKDRWREDDVPGSGLWMDLGPHLADQALCLFGLPLCVRADFFAARKGAKVEDWAHVVLDYESLRVVLHSSMQAGGGSSRFTVHGDRGSLIKASADRQEDQLKEGILPGDESWGIDPDEMTFFDGVGGVEKIATPRGDQCSFYRKLQRAVVENKPELNPVQPHEAIALMALLEAARISNEEGRAVELQLTEEERAHFKNTVYSG